MRLSTDAILPADFRTGTLVGRVWVEGPGAGPRPVVLRDAQLHDLTTVAATMSDLLDAPDPVELARTAPDAPLCSVQDSLDQRKLLAPCDLQAIKACGVTFVSSLMERVLEEQAQGDASRTARLRDRLEAQLGGALDRLKPGSENAMSLKQTLQDEGAWSQYLEVGIGPDPEVFSKAQPLSAVGCGAAIGLHPASTWSVSEPEVVLAVNASAEVVGATLGNDFTLRDFEGRSALLLGQSKDQNASCAIGPFLRLFDSGFSMDDVRTAEVQMRVEGEDGFDEQGANRMSGISRDPLELVAATMGATHQYPDGLMLFLGTMYVPSSDRSGPDSGFTHKPGDRVRIASERLGALINEITYCDQAEPWRFGFRALARSLAERGVWAPQCD